MHVHVMNVMILVYEVPCVNQGCYNSSGVIDNPRDFMVVIENQNYFFLYNKIINLNFQNY